MSASLKLFSTYLQSVKLIIYSARLYYNQSLLVISITSSDNVAFTTESPSISYPSNNSAKSNVHVVPVKFEYGILKVTSPTFKTIFPDDILEEEGVIVYAELPLATGIHELSSSSKKFFQSLASTQVASSKKSGYASGVNATPKSNTHGPVGNSALGSSGSANANLSIAGELNTHCYLSSVRAAAKSFATNGAD